MSYSAPSQNRSRAWELLIAIIGGGGLTFLAVFGAVFYWLGHGGVIRLLGGDMHLKTLEDSLDLTPGSAFTDRVVAQCTEQRIAVGGWCRALHPEPLSSSIGVYLYSSSVRSDKSSFECVWGLKDGTTRAFRASASVACISPELVR